MKRLLTVILCAFTLLMCGGICVSAEDIHTEETSVSRQQTEEEGPSRSVKIAGFLVIFTLAMGVTAYFTAAPKLKKIKKLKKEQSEKNQMQ